MSFGSLTVFTPDCSLLVGILTDSSRQESLNKNKCFPFFLLYYRIDEANAPPIALGPSTLKQSLSLN